MAPLNASENNLACSLLSARSHVLKYSQAAECSRVFLLDFQGLSPDILCFQQHHCTELIQRNDLKTEKYSSLTCCIVLMLFLLPSHCQFHQPQESRKLIRHKEQTLAVVCYVNYHRPLCVCEGGSNWWNPKAVPGESCSARPQMASLPPVALATVTGRSQGLL